MLCSPADLMEEDSICLSGFLDDLGIIADQPPAGMDLDFTTFDNVELSPIEDHARSLDMYFVPRSKVGPQERQRAKHPRDRMLRRDRALYEPQTDQMDIVSQFQHFGNFGSNSDSSSGNQEESPRKTPRIDPPCNDAFGTMLSHVEDALSPLAPSQQWPLDEPPFGTLMPMVPTLNLNLAHTKPDCKSLPFVSEPPNPVPRSRPVPVPSPRVRTGTQSKPVPQIPEGRAINNMMSTFGKDQPNDVQISRAVEKQRRKRRHALTERSRTRSLSAKIKQLGENLNASGIVCKMEKLPILTTAVDYVYTMQTTMSEKLQKQARLRAKIALLQEQIAAMKAPPAIEPGSLVYSQVFPHKPFPTAVIDEQFKIVDCSDSFLSMVNISKSSALNQYLPGLLSVNCPELQQLFSYCQKLLGGKIKKDTRPCLAALLQGSNYYAIVKELEGSCLQLSFLKESNARRIPGVTISTMMW